jgi:translation initiation factor 2-alpha kinase 4
VSDVLLQTCTLFSYVLHVEATRTHSQIAFVYSLSVQLGKQYPYVIPNIEFRKIKGLSPEQLAELMSQLKARAMDCSSSGSVMMIELVQVVEDFLAIHNHDPNMSAWEQMKAREAMEEDEKKRKEQEKEDVLQKLIQNETSTGELESPSGHKTYFTIGGEVQKELARQVEAFRQAGVKRQSDTNLPNLEFAPSNGDALGSEEGSGEFDEEDDDDPVIGSSRYRTDFVELGLLGRGGGGEVVKVRNRLDKRIYAIKKIILESEEGKYAKFGVVQNRKLRREVTTVSRMMHKNIVRYYQGWVEGGETAESAVPEELVEESDEGEEDSSSSGESESQGWWTSSPLMSGASGRIKSGEIEQRATTDGKVDEWGDDSSDADSKEWYQSDSGEDEVRNDFRSPLMVGMGFQNEMYEGLFDKKKTSSARPDTADKDPEDDGLWDESSVKVDHALGHRILYIQMEYCNTTLRKIIDDVPKEPVEETEKWKMLRQIVEALVYIHSQNLIHRDLVSFIRSTPQSTPCITNTDLLETREHFP